MANDCCYWLRVRGKKQKLSDFLNILNGTGPLVECEDEIFDGKLGRPVSRTRLRPDWVGRADFDEIEIVEKEVKKAKENSKITVGVRGVCAWSVQTAMLDGHHSIEELFEELELDAMEIWSDEPGIGFREHYCYEKGAGKTVDEEFDYDEILPAGFGSEAEEDEDEDEAWSRKQEAVDDACPMDNQCVFFPDDSKTKMFFENKEHTNETIISELFGQPSWKAVEGPCYQKTYR